MSGASSASPTLVGVDPSTQGFSYAVLEPQGQRYRVREHGTLALASLDAVYREAKALREAYPEAIAGVELLGEYAPKQARVAALYHTAYVAGAVQAAGFAGVPSSGASAWRALLTGQRRFASNAEANAVVKKALALVLVEVPPSNEDQRDAMAVAYISRFVSGSPGVAGRARRTRVSPPARPGKTAL